MSESTAMVKRDADAQALALPEDMDVFKLGASMAASGFFKDVRNEAQAVAKILIGRELGFGPAASLMGVYIVDGKPSMASNIIAAAIKRSGRYDYRVLTHTGQLCELQFRERVDGKWEEVGPPTSFSIEDASRAGLAKKDVWVKYPKNMLFNRALTNGARMYCPDVFVMGIYTPDELSDDYVLNDDGTTYRRVGPPANDQTPASEVLGTLEDPAVAKAREQAAARTATRAPRGTAKPATNPPADATNGVVVAPATITKAEGKDLVTLATECGWAIDELQRWLHDEHGVDSLAAIERSAFDAICRAVADPATLTAATGRTPATVAVDGEGRIL